MEYFKEETTSNGQTRLRLGPQPCYKNRYEGYFGHYLADYTYRVYTYIVSPKSGAVKTRQDLLKRHNEINAGMSGVIRLK
jgi:hypothetical protein